MLHDYLRQLEEIIDPAHAAAVEKRVAAAVSYESVDHLPVIVGFAPPEWPSFSYRETFEDPEKMLLVELSRVWASALVRDDSVYTIRANYGVGAVASILGCGVSLSADNAMPWVDHLSAAELDALLERGAPEDITAGLGGRILETEAYYQRVLADYEKLSSTVRIFLSDTQGPFDIAHLVMGHSIYTELYDNPARVQRLLDIVTETYIRFTRAQKELLGETGAGGFVPHTQMLIRGGTRVCDDSAINLSADFYREFCAPFNERALAAFGGGMVHYCGSGAQILDEVLALRGITCINFGQADMQDLSVVYPKAAASHIAVLAWNAPLDPALGIETGLTLLTSAPDLPSARALVNGAR